MKYAVTYFPTEYAIHPAELASALEERGFESLWVAEHSHIPASRLSPWPGGPELPQMYYDTTDPFVALSMAAQATTTLRLATGICLVVQRAPIHTAKSVASLDALSGGRFLFGVGAGWNLEEMSNHGTTPERRFKLMRERIEAMKVIWAEEQASYAGEFVEFEEIISNPKPAQKPHPPIHVGGGLPGGLRRAVRYGNGWIPIGGRDGEDICDHLPRVEQALEEAGRRDDDFEVSVFGMGPDKELVQRYAEGGISRVVFGAPPAGRDVVLPYLDKLASLIEHG